MKAVLRFPAKFVLTKPLPTDIDHLVPVLADEIPTELRRHTQHHATSMWSEVYGPLASQGGCQYGCKVYARRRGCVIEYAVLHSSSYGHTRRSA